MAASPPREGRVSPRHHGRIVQQRGRLSPRRLASHGVRSAV